LKCSWEHAEHEGEEGRFDSGGPTI
jgi:hypothetical protein